ncbi:MAG TPA: cytochrome c peroxidase [Myxococcus sp.]|nr:cytochrome c peroxidase [Myxococcus sp.]
MLRPCAIVLLLCALPGTACSAPRSEDAPASEARPRPEAPHGLVPLPAPLVAVSETPEVALGRKLFFDTRLSGDGRRSCASCHEPGRRFTDGRPVALGSRGAKLKRNTPALLNLEARGPYFWDGRAATLEEQALLPITHPDELAQDLGKLERTLAADPGYAARFREAFGAEGVTRATLARALAAFERTLVSAGSRYDRYLLGDTGALTAEEVHGMRLFAGKGECTTCHQGPLLTDNGFHNVGVAGDDPGRPEPGRGATFKTPSLRDVARTAPYFHDGSAATLEDVIDHYARGGAEGAPGARDIHPLALTPEEKRALVAFLRALDGA